MIDELIIFVKDQWKGLAVGGVLVGILGLILKAIIGEASKDIYAFAKKKIAPGPVEPVEVERRFEPIRYPPGSCSWVRVYDLYKKVDANWFHYRHSDKDGNVFRKVYSGNEEYIEWLMVNPDAEEIKD